MAHKVADLSSLPSATLPSDMLPRGSISAPRTRIAAGGDSAPPPDDTEFGSPIQEIGCAAVTDSDIGARVTMRYGQLVSVSVEISARLLKQTSIEEGEQNQRCTVQEVILLDVHCCRESLALTLQVNRSIDDW